MCVALYHLFPLLSLYFVCFANDDFMHWMLLTLTLINETVFDDSIMNSYTYTTLPSIIVFLYRSKFTPQSVWSCRFAMGSSSEKMLCCERYKNVIYNTFQGVKLSNNFTSFTTLMHQQQFGALEYARVLVTVLIMIRYLHA